MEELSAHLKAHREAQGLSLEDLFRRTRISTSYLRAIEAGSFDVLPEAYVRLFLKKVAQEIGLNPREILDQFEQLPHLGTAAAASSPRKSGPPPRFLAFALGLVLVVGAVAVVLLRRGPSDAPPTAADPSGPAAIQAPSHTVLPASGAQRDGSPTTASGASPPVITPAVNVGKATSLAPEATAGRDRVEPAPPPGTIESPSATSAELADGDAAGESGDVPQGAGTPWPGQTDSVAAGKAQHGTSPSAPGPARELVVSAYSLPPVFTPGSRDTFLALGVAVVDTAQVRVAADGKLRFEGILLPGGERLWKARSRFIIEIQEASTLSLSLQGNPLSPPFKPGRKLRLFISRSSIWVQEIEPPSHPPSVLSDL